MIAREQETLLDMLFAQRPHPLQASAARAGGGGVRGGFRSVREEGLVRGSQRYREPQQWMAYEGRVEPWGFACAGQGSRCPKANPARAGLSVPWILKFNHTSMQHRMRTHQEFFALLPAITSKSTCSTTCILEKWTTLPRHFICAWSTSWRLAPSTYGSVLRLLLLRVSPIFK